MFDVDTLIVDVLANGIFLFVPILLVALFVSPLLFLMLRKKKFTVQNVSVSLLIGVGFVALGLYLLYWAYYWGAVYLQGEAFKAIYDID